MESLKVKFIETEHRMGVVRGWRLGEMRDVRMVQTSRYAGRISFGDLMHKMDIIVNNTIIYT